MLNSFDISAKFFTEILLTKLANFDSSSDLSTWVYAAQFIIISGFNFFMCALS